VSEPESSNHANLNRRALLLGAVFLVGGSAALLRFTRDPQKQSDAGAVFSPDEFALLEQVTEVMIPATDTPGVFGVHDLRTRKMGDLIVVDAHLDVDATLTIDAGHAIALAARERVMARHRVLDVMTHLDPWRPETSGTSGGARSEHERSATLTEDAS